MKKTGIPLTILFLLIYPLHLLLASEKALDELLNLSLEELTNIQIITASKIPQRIKQVPATVRVITAQQIQNCGYHTLEEALADLPGMQFRNTIGYNSYVFMRGVPSQNNLILLLIDGIQVNELNSGGFYGGAQYNLSNVEQIEIVYGPAASLYGTNAISGIINIITKTPDKNNGLDIQAMAGSFNTINTNVGYGFWDEKNKLGVRLSGMYKTSDKADLAGDAGDNNWSDDIDTNEKDYTWDARVKWQGLYAGFNYINKQASSATYVKSVGTPYHDNGTLWNIRFINAFIKYNAQISKNTGINSRIYYRNATVLDNSVLIVSDTLQVGYYRPNNLVGFETLINYAPIEKLNLLGGIVLENENLAQGYSNTYSGAWNIKPPKPSSPDMERNTLASLYYQLRYQPVQPVQFYAGTRFDNSSVYDQVLTPRMAAVYNKNHLTMKLLYTEAFRAPKPWDYSDGSGNSDLEPEEMTSYEFYTAYMLKSSLKLDGSVYINKLKNLFIWKELKNSWRWINYGELDTKGFELCLTYQKQSSQLYFNYSLNHTTDENDVIIPEISKHQFNIGAQYKFNDKIHCAIRGNYIDKRKNNKTITSTGKEYVDAAFIVHATSSFIINKNFSINLILKNMLNEEYYHTSNHTSNLRPDRYRQPQRSVALQVNYCLK